MDTFSACMIVKNEEENMRRCLDSIAPLCDEIVIVDTGSQDATVDIAQSYGAKIYHHTWRENFSLHRNQSIKYATMDWLLIIDADGEMRIEDGLTVEQVKKDFTEMPANITAVGCLTQDMQDGRVAMEGMPVRFFRRETSNLCFKRKVHNKFIFDGDAMHYPHLIFYHYGYALSPAKMEAKKQRTLTLLNSAVREDPNDWELHYYLNQSYCLTGEHHRALMHGKTYWEHRHDVASFNPVVCFTNYRCAYYLGEEKEARKWVERGLKEYPKSIDVLYGAVEFAGYVNDAGLLEYAAEKYIQLYEKMQDDPRLGRKAFTLCYKPEIYAHCIYILSVVKIKKGVAYAKDLGRFLSLDLVPPKYAKKLVATFHDDLSDTQADKTYILFREQLHGGTESE